MDKNTVWAIVLSTLVIIAFFFVQPLFSPTQNSDATPAEQQTQQTHVSDASTISPSSPALEAVGDDAENVSEETITITTDKVRAVFTNKGGDLISYELLDHTDTDTGRGVEMVDNVSDFNRACAISFGRADARVINELFSVEQPDAYTVLFTRRFNNFVFGKRYTFMPGEYMFKLEILAHGDGAMSLNTNGAAYTIRTSPQIGPHFDTRRNRYESRQFLFYDGDKKRTTNVGTNQYRTYDKSRGNNFTWAGIAGKYFEALVVPASETVSVMDSNVQYSSRIEVNDYANAQSFFTRKPFSGTDMTDTFYMYFGPRNEADLRAYNIGENNGWQLENLRLTESMQTSGWLSWLENILKWILELLYRVVHNWGVAIIVMTILLKLAMFPLTRKQSLGTLKMQKIQPQMQALQEHYKDNPQKLQMEMQKLYRESGYNPMSGCLPMLFQFLIIFAMFNLFNNYFEFRGASFIPGWISDLSSGDSVYTFPWNIPFLGNSLRLLPIIYLASQLLYGKITMMGGTAGAGSGGQMKFMMYGMPLMFFFLFYNAPSGLLLYWTTSNFIQLGQQLVINKIMAREKANMETEEVKRFKIVKKRGKKRR